MVSDEEINALALQHGIKIKTQEQRENIREELLYQWEHTLPGKKENNSYTSVYMHPDSFYIQNDITAMQGFSPQTNAYQRLGTLDELLERDEQRAKDGFPKKISVGRIVKPSASGGRKVVVVPTATEEKFYHDPRRTQKSDGGDGEGEESDSGDSGGETGGSGEGEEGEVVDEEPIHEEGGHGQGGAGSGQGGEHELESEAYEIGKLLKERFYLPNLQEKGLKRTFKKYTYDLTDSKKGTGQVLNKRKTLKEIIKTNYALGTIDEDNIDPKNLVIHNRDFVYHLLSEEKEYESQALIFFVRDYSGSMRGQPTDSVVSQHLLIYSWLLYEYENKVQSRFLLHDEEVREVEDFYTYYNLSVAGGTQVAPAFAYLNNEIERESLDRYYNIYILYGGDGGDWDAEGEYALPEIGRSINYANRIGFTIAKNRYQRDHETAMEEYLRRSGLLEKYPQYIRLDSFVAGAEEDRLIEGIKELLSENENS